MIQPRPYFIGYDIVETKEGKIQKEIVSQGVKRQPLERAKKEVQIFVPIVKKFRIPRIQKLTKKQIDFLRDLNIKGYLDVARNVKYGQSIKSLVRRLRLKGYRVKQIRLLPPRVDRKYAVLINIVYLAGREIQVYNEIINKHPCLIGKPGYVRQIEYILFRNLHQSATALAVRGGKISTRHYAITATGQ